MDESFQSRDGKLLNGAIAPVALDHELLRAALTAQQASSPTASAQKRACAARQAKTGLPDPLTELLLAGSGWKDAASAQHGCFNRAETRRRRNKP